MSKEYNIFNDGKGWVAKEQSATRPSSRHETQKDAYDAAKGYLNNTPGGGDISIHRKDNNQIREKNTINKKDPNPPKG